MNQSLSFFQKISQSFQDLDTAMRSHNNYQNYGSAKNLHYQTVISGKELQADGKTLKTFGSVSIPNEFAYSMPSGLFNSKSNVKPVTHDIVHSSYSTDNKQPYYHDQAQFQINGGTHQFNLNGYDSLILDFRGADQNSNTTINNSGANILKIKSDTSTFPQNITINNPQGITVSFNGKNQNIDSPPNYDGPVHLKVDHVNSFSVIHGDRIIDPNGKHQHLGLSNGDSVAIDLRNNQFHSETAISSNDGGLVNLYYTEKSEKSNSFTHAQSIYLMNPANTSINVNGEKLDLLKGHEDHTRPIKLDFTMGEMRVSYPENAYFYDQNLGQAAKDWQNKSL